MTVRLIDADALFEPNENTDKVLIHGGRTGGKTIALAERLMRERVGMAPTITLDDLRPHGRWIGKNSPYDVNIHICSECREQVSILGNKLRFCPNCGAKMDLKE